MWLTYTFEQVYLYARFVTGQVNFHLNIEIWSHSVTLEMQHNNTEYFARALYNAI